MLKLYKYRLYPNMEQEKRLEATLEACRWLYNYCLEERRNAWQQNQQRLTAYDQIKELPELKKKYQFLSSVYSQVLQIEEPGKVPERISVVFDGALPASFCLFEINERLVQRSKGAPRIFGFPASWHKITPLPPSFRRRKRGARQEVLFFSLCSGPKTSYPSVRCSQFRCYRQLHGYRSNHDPKSTHSINRYPPSAIR